MCDHCGCRSFPPIAELTAEHEEILRLAWALAESERVGRRPVPEDAADLVRLLRLHVVKEETGLYPELIASGGLSTGQLAELEEEHRRIGDALTGLAFDRRDYYALAAHIEVEEMELFPAAMFGFDDEVWDTVDDAHRAAGDPAGTPT